MCDLIEGYGRPTGHADLLRGAMDGRVGEAWMAATSWPSRSGQLTAARTVRPAAMQNGDPGAPAGAHPSGMPGQPSCVG